MNKILNINLGGYPLTIDEDAYEYLESYLGSIRRRFSESDGRDEILTDIESRLGELISQNMGRRTIVMLPDVESAVQVMGKPEEFGADPIDNHRSMGGATTSRSSLRTGRRLFRDEEDATVGGVCSGLAAYFGIQDPIWMRLIFVLLFFVSVGFWVPVYILLWILVPPAKTAADRLAMRGEPVNVDNIAKEIEVGFDRFGKKVNEFGESVKKKNGTASGERSFGNAVAGGVSVLGRMFGFFLKFVAKFGILILMAIGLAMFVALVVSWVVGIWSAFSFAPHLHYFSPYSNTTTYFWVTNLFLVLSIPIVGLILLFVRALFKSRTPRWLSATLGAVWGINMVSLVMLSVFGFRGFRTQNFTSKTMELNGINSDTLRVEGLGESNDDFHIGYNDDIDDWDFPGKWQNDKLTLQVPVDIRVVKSKNGQFRVVQNVYARGKNDTEALMNATQIGYDLTQTGNVLKVPLGMELEKGQRWRNQKVRIFIEMPEGKSVVFDEKIYHHAAADMDDYAKGNDRNYISRTPGRVFKMTNNGLACTECPGWGDNGYDYENNYEEFILEGNFTTEIRDGENFSVQISGADVDKKQLKSIQSGNKLTLTTEGKTLGSPVKVSIVCPTFTSLYCKNSGDVNITGFEEGRASISVRGDNMVRGYFDCDHLEVNVDGNGKIDLTGKGREIDVILNGNGVLEATAFRVDNATIFTRDNSRARLNVRDSYSSKNEGNSSTTVDGPARKREERQD